MTENNRRTPPPGKLIERVDLPNGLTIELYDYSRAIAGDRWFVGILARIPIPVRPEYFKTEGQGAATFEEFTAARGRVVDFEVRKERNFIDARKKDETLIGLLDRLKRDALPYMGHADFARGVVRRAVNEYVGRRNWWKETR